MNGTRRSDSNHTLFSLYSAWLEDGFVIRPCISLRRRSLSATPSIGKGVVTFGCFNNTGKLHAGVLALWARILDAVPGSRLLLKWRTFQDAGMGQEVRATFARYGISPDGIYLRV